MVCNSQLTRHNLNTFWKQIITSDEKWVIYDNSYAHKQWLSPGEVAIPTPKTGITNRKTMLCVWWDYKGIVHQELLNYGQTVNSDLYCNQLDRLKEVLIQNRPELVNRKGVILFHDNTNHTRQRRPDKKLRNWVMKSSAIPPSAQILLLRITISSDLFRCS